ncbi:MAG TPA: hypothetical protein VNC60_10240 [Actinomycetota bacterium]|nr:hypothetical protein [Actinomycetota bacterium]
MYRFWVFVHLVGVVGFLVTHGVSMWAMFAVRAVGTDRDRILDGCENSKTARVPMYVSLGLLLLGGVAAGIDGALFAQWWLLASLGILLALTASMSMIATPHMKRLREGCTRWADGSYTLTDEELEAVLAGPATMITAATGTAAVLLIVFLMVFKPGS